MGLGGAGFQLGMELYTNEPGMVRDFDDFDEAFIRRLAGHPQAGGFQAFTEFVVILIAVAVPLGNLGFPVRLIRAAARRKHAGIQFRQGNPSFSFKIWF